MELKYNSALHLWLICATTTILLFSPKLLAEKDVYIVHMDPSAMPKAFSSHHSWHSSTLSSVFEASKTTISSTSTAHRPSKHLYSYTHVINGFSAYLSPQELDILKKSPGYISSVKDHPAETHTTYSPSYIGLTSNSQAWQLSNYGEGVIIGIIDSGVWPESESFSDYGMPKVPKRWEGKCESGTQFNSSLCNNKLIGARAFNKGVLAKNNVTLSMNSTRDTEGHGTHTSSTAAGNFVKGASYFGYANGTASGVAPRAHIAMYKVLWEEAPTSTADVLAAIDEAIIDGVDILSISMGWFSIPMAENPVAIATFAAMEKNIFVSTSAGNRGPYLGTVQNGYPWVTTVAAGTIDRQFNAILKLGNGASVTGLSTFPGKYATSKQVPIIFEDCFHFTESPKTNGSIVVCEELNGNSDDLNDQYQNLRFSKTNIVGGIFITKRIDLEDSLLTRIPSIFFNFQDGKKIKDYINSTSKPKASMLFGKTALGIKPAPSVASYSSRGPYLDSQPVFKPDIMAPGSQILAAWPPNVFIDYIYDDKASFTDFNLLSGTSMACPHVSGVAALLKKAHPEWSTAAIRSAIMTTADIMTPANEPIEDVSDTEYQSASPLDMGAGQINPNRALDPGLIYDVNKTDYVNLLCSLNLTTNQIKTITRSPHNDCSSPSSDLNYPAFIAYFNADPSEANLTAVQEYHRTVSNVGDAESTYTAHLTSITGIQVSVVPNKLVFKAKYQKLSYKVTIKGPKSIPEWVVFGYLKWVDSKGKYVVNSPITVVGKSDFDYDD